MKSKTFATIGLLFALFFVPSSEALPWFAALRAETLADAFVDDEAVIGVFEVWDCNGREYWHTGDKEQEFHGLYQLIFEHHVVPLFCLERFHGNIPELVFVQTGEAVKVMVNGRELEMFLEIPGTQWILALEPAEGDAALPDFLQLPASASAPDLPCASIKTNLFHLFGDRMGSLMVHENRGPFFPISHSDEWNNHPWVADIKELSRVWKGGNMQGRRTTAPPLDVQAMKSEFGKLLFQRLSKNAPLPPERPVQETDESTAPSEVDSTSIHLMK